MRTSSSNRTNRVVSLLPEVHGLSPARILCAFTLVLSLLAGSPLTAQPVLYVDADASGPTHDGSNWCDAFLHLQDALADADASGGVITEIRVAEGVYRPDQGAAQYPGDRSATFQLISGVSIFGGYAGCAEPDPDERDPNRYETVLSGDLNGDDDEKVGEGTPGVCCYDDGATECDDPACIAQVCRIMADCCTYDWTYSCRRIAHTLCCDCQDPLTTRSDNSAHVVTGSGTDASALIDGFTITAGNADGFGLHMLGGGMLIFEGSPTIANCTFTGNRVGHFQDGRTPRCPDGGAGLYTTYGSPRLINCVFRGNRSARYGGGMANAFGSPTLVNCLFTGNTAKYGGGGLATAEVEFCTTTIINCTFSSNSAGWSGGVYALSRGVIILSNSILWGNSDDEGMGLTAQLSPWSTWALSHTCIQGFDDGGHEWYGGVGIIGDDPMFVDADGPDDIPGTADDDLRLMPDSPCINTGDPGFVPGPGETDLDGQPRLQGCRVDMGAYESDVLQLTGDFDSDGDFDLADFAYLQLCFNAEESNPDWLDACICGFDFDETDTIDLADYAAFKDAVTGPGP